MTAITELLIRTVERDPERILFAEPAAGRISAYRFRQMVLATAAALRRQGVGRDHRVAIACDKLAWSDAATCYLAAAWTGAVPVLAPEHPFLPAEQVGIRRWFEAANVSSEPVELLPANASGDVLDIVFTSGTTGDWKTVATTHALWIETLPAAAKGPREARVVAHGGVPFAASAGVHGVFLHHLARAVTSVWAPTPPELIALSVDAGATELHLTPHSLQALLRHVETVPQAWAAEVRVIKTVGGMVPADVGTRAMATFPNARLVCLYGLTEAGAALCIKVFDPERPDSIGRPLPGTEVAVFDERGTPQPPGVVGEIAVRTRAMPAEMANAEGWVLTGDLGFTGPRHEIHLVGRIKELLFLSTGRTSPTVIEGALSTAVPAGVDFAVAGAPKSGSWDRIVVFVARELDDADMAGAVAALSAVDGPYRPDEVRVVDQIPRTSSGKVRRGELARL